MRFGNPAFKLSGEKPTLSFGKGGGLPAGTYNWSPTYLAIWKAAREAVRAGSANTRILCVGDSTTAGLDSVGGGVAVGMKLASYPAKLAQLLAAAGINASNQNCFGDFGYGANAPVYDTRLALGSWTVGSPNALSGQNYFAGAATAQPLSFTPTEETDTCEIYYLTGGSTGSFNANTNGGSNTLRATNVGNGYGKITLSSTLGNNVYNVTWASGGNVFIVGFNAFNSASKAVHVLNVGKGGGKAGDLTGAWVSAAAAMTVFTPSLVIIEVGINDWFVPTALGTFSTHLQTLIDAAQAAGADVLLVSPIKSNPSYGTSEATQQTYLDYYPTKAVAENAVLLDLNARWGGSFAAANGNGFYGSDGVHGSAAGYLDQANALKQLLLAA